MRSNVAACTLPQLCRACIPSQVFLLRSCIFFTAPFLGVASFRPDTTSDLARARAVARKFFSQASFRKLHVARKLSPVASREVPLSAS